MQGSATSRPLSAAQLAAIARLRSLASEGNATLGAEVGANGGGDSHGFNGGLKASYAF